MVDLANQRFSKLVAIEVHSRDRHGRLRWLCKCDCGNTSVVQSGNLRTGVTKSCGCNLHKPSICKKDSLNKRFHRLVTIEEIKKGNKIYYICKCDCGNIATVWGAKLRHGTTKSCGCYKKEQSAKANKKRLTGKTGKDSIRYNPNLTEEDRKKDRGDLSKKWSRKILELNNFTCNKCDKKGGRLHAHHLDGYSANKEKRLLLSNGVCLCKPCHIEYHSEFKGKPIEEIDYHKWIGAPTYDITDLDLLLPLPTEGNLGNTVKYISRWGKKQNEENDLVQDLKKAKWYLERKIAQLENKDIL